MNDDTTTATLRARYEASAEPPRMLGDDDSLPIANGYRAVVQRRERVDGRESLVPEYDSQAEHETIFESAVAALEHAQLYIEHAVMRELRVDALRHARQATIGEKLRESALAIKGLKAQARELAADVKEREALHVVWTLDADEPAVTMRWDGRQWLVEDAPCAFTGELDSKGEPVERLSERVINSLPDEAPTTPAEQGLAKRAVAELEAAEQQVAPAGSVGVDQGLLDSRPWARSTIGSLLRAEQARAKPRRKILDLLEDHPFSAGGPHDAAAVLILTSQTVSPVEALVEALGQLLDIEVVREVMTRENRRKGPTRPREIVIEACERALERLMGGEGGNVH